VIRLVAYLLIAEGLLGALWLANLVPVIAAHGPVTIALIVARGLVAAAQLMSGWLLIRRRPPGAPIARGALLASAALVILEIGLRLAPSNLDPTFRWPVVAAYGAYAMALRWSLRPEGPGLPGPR
jgi:hypothetical protein